MRGKIAAVIIFVMTGFVGYSLFFKFTHQKTRTAKRTGVTEYLQQANARASTIKSQEHNRAVAGVSVNQMKIAAVNQVKLKATETRVAKTEYSVGKVKIDIVNIAGKNFQFRKVNSGLIFDDASKFSEERIMLPKGMALVTQMKQGCENQNQREFTKILNTESLKNFADRMEKNDCVSSIEIK